MCFGKNGFDKNDSSFLLAEFGSGKDDFGKIGFGKLFSAKLSSAKLFPTFANFRQRWFQQK